MEYDGVIPGIISCILDTLPDILPWCISKFQCIAHTE